MEFKFKVNGKEYDFKYDNLVFDISSQDFAADIISVTCDGKEKDNYFGVSFGGYSYTAEDALCASIVAYVNNDTSYDFIEIPSEIKKIRSGFFKKQLTTNGRDIPKQILTPELEVGDVKMITKDGQAAYLDDYGSVTVLTYPDGSIATDMENFFIEGTIDLYQEKEIVFIDPEFEESLKENLMDESVRVKTVVNKILEGVPVLEAIFDDEVPADSVIAGEDFIASAKKFSSYLLRTYPFISKVDPDIRFETKYISNFFIEVETKVSYYMPEKSISEFGLNNLIQGEKVYYGAGDDVGEVEYSIESVGWDLSDLFYKDALKFDLVPVKTKKSYSIMTHSKESYYYRISNSGDNLHLRLEFYTDIGLAGNQSVVNKRRFQ